MLGQSGQRLYHRCSDRPKVREGPNHSARGGSWLFFLHHKIGLCLLDEKQQINQKAPQRRLLWIASPLLQHDQTNERKGRLGRRLFSPRQGDSDKYPWRQNLHRDLSKLHQVVLLETPLLLQTSQSPNLGNNRLDEDQLLQIREHCSQEELRE